MYFPSPYQGVGYPNWMLQAFKLASTILSRSYYLFSLQRRVDPQQSCLLKKIKGGFKAYEHNTDVPHPLAPKLGHLDKRSAPGNVSLTDSSPWLWYGTIQVGNPSRNILVGHYFGVTQLSKLIT
jgi:hypothetical protein